MTEEIKTTEEKSVKMSKMPKMNVWMITSIILVIILAAVLIFFGTGTAGMVVAGSNVLSPEDASLSALEFINENFVAPDTEASFVSVKEIGNVYNITLSYQGNNIPVYVTKDGTYMFLTPPVDITESLPEPEEQEQTQQQQPPEVPKTNKPEAHAFIMSYCPYGLQFLNAYTPVIDLFGDKADLEVNFVNYIMHGEKEIQENNRIHCIQREQNDKFTDYLRCFMEKDDWETCYSEVGIDKSKIDACITQIDSQFKITELYNDKSTWRGGNYPQYPVDNALISLFQLEADGRFGSPTFVLNGKEISVQRTPEAIKQAICSAFNNPPEECSQVLSGSSNPTSGSC